MIMDSFLLTMFFVFALNYGFQFFFLNLCCLINLLRYLGAGKGAGAGTGAGTGAGAGAVMRVDAR